MSGRVSDCCGAPVLHKHSEDIMIDLRRAILDALIHNDWTTVKFARRVQEAGGPSMNTTYRYLRGEIDSKGENISVMLSICGIGLTKPHRIPSPR